jgi:hypothetical protein
MCLYILTRTGFARVKKPASDRAGFLYFLNTMFFHTVLPNPNSLAWFERKLAHTEDIAKLSVSELYLQKTMVIRQTMLGIMGVVEKSPLTDHNEFSLCQDVSNQSDSPVRAKQTACRNHNFVHRSPPDNSLIKPNCARNLCQKTVLWAFVS